MKVVVDTEWDGFEGNNLWFVVFRDIETDKVTVFRHPIIESEFVEFAKGISLWVGHNFIHFDRPCLLNYFPSLSIPLDGVLDTFVVSNFLNHNIEGGHSLEAWAKRLKRPGDEGMDKVGIEDFSAPTEELLERCISDTIINKRLYTHFQKYLARKEFKSPIETEHKTAYLCHVLQRNGFAIDVPLVRELEKTLTSRLSALDDALQKAFPPERIISNTVVPRETASGAIHAVDYRRLVQAGYDPKDIVAGREYPIYSTVVFDPGSLKQTIDKLWEAGWEPTEKTKGHIDFTKSRENKSTEAYKARLERFKKYGWKLSDENLLTLPDTAPEAAKSLTERLMVSSRIKVVEAWLKLLQPDGRIHGRFWHIGAWTGRLSHSDPNMANVPKVQDSVATEVQRLSNEINKSMRAAWIAPEGRRLVGVDADGIQMRIFAHYVNDERLTNALISGDKAEGTDIHSVHQRALGEVCLGRDAAKTFIYAWLLGAGLGKVSEILRCSYGEAKGAVDNFLRFYPGLQELKRTKIPADARRGYFIGLDGRPVICDSEHLMLAGYLQSGESVIMKRAMIDWHSRLTNEGIDFKFVNFVHDEWCLEVPDDNYTPEYVEEVLIESIRKQGEELGLNCPLEGTGAIGANWLEVH